VAWEDSGRSNYADVDGLEFDLDITLFGSKFLTKTTLSGITGQKFDKLKILVGVPVRVKVYDGKKKQIINPVSQLLEQLIIIER